MTCDRKASRKDSFTIACLVWLCLICFSCARLHHVQPNEQENYAAKDFRNQSDPVKSIPMHYKTIPKYAEQNTHRQTDKYQAPPENSGFLTLKHQLSPLHGPSQFYLITLLRFMTCDRLQEKKVSQLGSECISSEGRENRL